jgi:hypothetical protein
MLKFYVDDGSVDHVKGEIGRKTEPARTGAILLCPILLELVAFHPVHSGGPGSTDLGTVEFFVVHESWTLFESTVVFSTLF